MRKPFPKVERLFFTHHSLGEGEFLISDFLFQDWHPDFWIFADHLEIFYFLYVVVVGLMNNH